MKKCEMGEECSTHVEKLIQNCGRKPGRRETPEDLYVNGEI